MSLLINSESPFRTPERPTCLFLPRKIKLIFDSWFFYPESFFIFMALFQEHPKKTIHINRTYTHTDIALYIYRFMYRYTVLLHTTCTDELYFWVHNSFKRETHGHRAWKLVAYSTVNLKIVLHNILGTIVTSSIVLYRHYCLVPCCTAIQQWTGEYFSKALC